MKEFEIVTKIKLWPFEELHPNDRQLVEMAIKATEGAYAEYSHFYVGAAARLADGTIVTGANQENAAFPSSLCAERTTLFAAQANYPTQPVETIAIAARNDNGFLKAPISPCGACRQVMTVTARPCVCCFMVPTACTTLRLPKTSCRSVSLATA